MKKICLFLLLVAVVCFAFSCGNSNQNGVVIDKTDPRGVLSEIENRGVIQITTACDAEPWQFKDINGNPAGASLDIQRLLAKELGVKLEISDQAFATVIPGLLTHKADIVATTLSVTLERAKQIRFVDELVYTTGSQIYIRTEDKERLTEFNKFLTSGFKLGAVAGTFHEATAKKYFPKTDILTFDSDIDLFQALLTKKVDAAINAETTQVIVDQNYPGKMITVKNPRKYVENDSWAYAVRPGDEFMACFLKVFIQRAKANGSIQAIYDYWTGSDQYREDFFTRNGMSEERKNLIEFLGIQDYDPYFSTIKCLSYEK